MNQPLISEFEGKQGRHPKDCFCSKHRPPPTTYIQTGTGIPLGDLIPTNLPKQTTQQMYPFASPQTRLQPANIQGFAMTTNPSFVPQNNIPQPEATPVAPATPVVPEAPVAPVIGPATGFIPTQTPQQNAVAPMQGATVSADIPLPVGETAIKKAPEQLSDHSGMPGQTPLDFYFVGRTGNGNGKYFVFKPRKRVAGREAILLNSINVHMDLFGGIEPKAGEAIFYITLINAS